ncbi:hypothetical protein K438DRAFT_1810896 [Mycena galopus ATCC 62051]|nr:hypothetical protein K438DRAFT_1810896 [Mycena galopus ATCC 62051]
MVTDSPPDEGALLIPCTHQDQHFSFTSCPHSDSDSSHGCVCTTTDARKHSVYPSPPPTNSQPKRNVPLPAAPAAARYQQHHFGGVLDSPVVLMKAPGHTLWSPPPTIPIPTHALPPADALDASFLLPIAEQYEPQSRSPKQLLSPISPDLAPRKPEDVFAVDEAGDCVLMSQPSGAYEDYDSFAADVDDDILSNAGAFGRPALHPLDIPRYRTKGVLPMHELHDEDAAGQSGVLLGFHGVMPQQLIEGGEDNATSPFEYMPPSPSSLRDFDFDSSSPSSASESDLDDLDLKFDMGSSCGSGWGAGPSSYSPSPLRSFASLPSPDLDDLDLDMDLGPGLGMSPSPSRRSHAPGNALCLDLPAGALPQKAPPAPSILDAFSPAQLAARLSASFPQAERVEVLQAELDALLAVRERAHVALAACTAAPPSSSAESSLALDHELRRTVPRDAGEPRRRRKRAKELGREVDAIVGLALGLLPPSSDPSSSASSSSSSLSAPDPEKKAVKDKATGATTLRREKAGLAGLASVPQLVARMILRRRERCVRGLDSAGARGRLRAESPLRVCLGLEGDEPPPSPGPTMMELDELDLDDD